MGGKLIFWHKDMPFAENLSLSVLKKRFLKVLTSDMMSLADY